MINAQHAHIYRIHTLHFIFGEIFFLQILSILTNSAHDSGVVSECKKGNCTKELDVQFLSSNSSNETER